MAKLFDVGGGVHTCELFVGRVSRRHVEKRRALRSLELETRSCCGCSKAEPLANRTEALTALGMVRRRHMPEKELVVHADGRRKSH